ncbi:hypothetical protein [Paenibacillus sp. JZ16]|uniref:hypothetical protein n=1 Tax=Paenibacillus sp. JZ16 TaxID=1906272 RepID=UPI00188DB165|nr:hypothetical protein [Paenibacillus sp. JZ16]
MSKKYSRLLIAGFVGLLLMFELGISSHAAADSARSAVEWAHKWVIYEKAYIFKIDKNGNTLWYNKYNYTDSVAFNDLIPANDGGYIGRWQRRPGGI